MSNRFAALSGQVPLSEDKPKGTEFKGRDNKRHEPHAPDHGRQYDRNSVKGEKRFPPKEGAGKGGWGNPKDRKPREETAEQKERREQYEKEHVEMLEKHKEYLASIQTLEAEPIVVNTEVKVTKNIKVDDDLAKFGKKQEEGISKKGGQKQKVILDNLF